MTIEELQDLVEQAEAAQGCKFKVVYIHGGWEVYSSKKTLNSPRNYSALGLERYLKTLGQEKPDFMTTINVPMLLVRTVAAGLPVPVDSTVGRVFRNTCQRALDETKMGVPTESDRLFTVVFVQFGLLCTSPLVIRGGMTLRSEINRMKFPALRLVFEGHPAIYSEE